MIALFGASLADSAVTEHALAEATGRPVERVTKPGKPLTQWAQLIPPAGSRAGDTFVVIEAGGNGVATAAQVRDADRRLRATGATRVVWIVFADWPNDSRAADARRATRDIVRANARDVLVLPRPPASDLAGDRVHFTSAGYRALGLAIAHGLSQRGSLVGLAIMGTLTAVAGFLFWKTAK